MVAYYNEIDPYAAQWLRNLISAGEIAPGVVDERSIRDVRPVDLDGFAQCHFFAGIGGWSLALRRAGVPDSYPVWTGSCPCQPFSTAGRRGGFDDDRHLWPAFFDLIRQRRPRLVVGEQVASRDGLAWFDAVRSDMEDARYACGAVDLCAAGLGAPHIRQRLWWVGRPVRAEGYLADDAEPRRGTQPFGHGREDGRPAPEPRRLRDARELADMRHGALGSSGELSGATTAHEAASPREGWHGDDGTASHCSTARELADEVDQRHDGRHVRGAAAGTPGGGAEVAGRRAAGLLEPPRRGADGEQEYAVRAGGGRDARAVPGPEGEGAGERRRAWRVPDELVDAGSDGAHLGKRRPNNGGWADPDWLRCRDGRWRPVEPGTFPLVDGLSFKLGSGSAYEGKSRTGMLKGYGNAIVLEVAVAFLDAVTMNDDLPA